MAKKILINANTICLPRWGGEGYISGVGRSTSNLLEAFDKIDDKELKIGLMLEGPQYIGRAPNFNNLHITYSPLYSRLGFGKILRRYILRPDIYHYPDNFNIHNYGEERYVLTIHDMIQYKKALLNQDIKRINRYKDKVKESELIFTCSEYSKKVILQYMDIPEEKIKVVYWGIDTNKFKILNVDSYNEIYNHIGGRYFLTVSCKDERKNMKNLLKAYEEYQKTSNDKLVLIWSNPPQEILYKYSQLINNKKLIFLNFVSDAGLIKLYNGAIATMFPSREEGFGFPILESFACGTPVMTCNNSSLPEVGGDLANYVGEDSIDEMVDTMRFFSNKFDKNAFGQKAQIYVKQFSWNNTAKKYLDIYKKL